MSRLGTIREFNTKNFKVEVVALEECDLDLSYDTDGEVLRGLESGEVVVFCAAAYVYEKSTGAELASDYLGDCVYDSIEAFMNHKECGKRNRELEAAGEMARCGSYVSEMISTVCEEARENLRVLRAIKVRS